jgi:hypothetical protein
MVSSAAKTIRELVSSLGKMMRIAEVFNVKWALIPETVDTLRKLGVVGQECSWNTEISPVEHHLIVTTTLQKECFILWQLATNSYMSLKEVHVKRPEMVIFCDSSVQKGAVVITRQDGRRQLWWNNKNVSPKTIFLGDGSHQTSGMFSYGFCNV